MDAPGRSCTGAGVCSLTRWHSEFRRELCRYIYQHLYRCDADQNEGIVRCSPCRCLRIVRYRQAACLPCYFREDPASARVPMRTMKVATGHQRPPWSVRPSRLALCEYRMVMSHKAHASPRSPRGVGPAFCARLNAPARLLGRPLAFHFQGKKMIEAGPDGGDSAQFANLFKVWRNRSGEDVGPPS
jgi:hypothetical protein